MSYNINNSNLLIYYPFNTNTSNYASGYAVNDATTPLSINATTKLSSGSLYFPGTDQTTKVKAVNTTFTTNGITFALWFKNSGSIPGGNNSLFDFGLGTNGNGHIMLFFGGGGALSYVGYGPATSSTGAGGNTESGYRLVDNNWHHYVLTISPDGIWTPWVDGVQYQASTWTIVPSTSTRTFCQIGTNNFSNTPINGYMNQFLVFNRVLTLNEISMLAAVPSQIKFSSAESSTFLTPTYNINNSNLLIYYPFNTNTSNYASGSAVNDSTTPLSISNATTKLSNGSLYFSGVDQTSKVKAVNTTFTTKGITFAVWFKNAGSIPGSNNSLFDFGLGENYNGNIMFYFAYSGALSHIGYNPVTSSGGVFGNNASGFTLADNNWHHYVLTISPDGIWTPWVDGIQYQSPAWTIVPSTSQRMFCQIGANNFDNPPINGYMNQFLVFNRVLTLNEISMLAAVPSQIKFSSTESSNYLPSYSGATVTTSNGYTFYTFTDITGSITFPSNVTAQVLVVGGGGGGGGTVGNYESAGGGGGGGVGVGSLTFTANSAYSISVGNGGTAGVGTNTTITTASTSGSNTTITGTSISETARGGGYGANSSNQPGGNGGSGGGGNGFGVANPGGTATTGTGSLTYYGNTGGSGPNGLSGGGGGGATSAGAAGADASGGNGGSGYTWTLNGGVYGGGGGGGLEGTQYATLGTGTYGKGSGGGGNGGISTVSAVSGLANTGGGGGGAYGGTGNGGTGGRGGSGVVIIAVPTLYNGDFGANKITDNSYQYPILTTSLPSTSSYFPGWTFVGNAAVVIANGGSNFNTNMATGQQCLIIQNNDNPGNTVASQSVYLNPGNYNINFYASYRPRGWSSLQTLSVGISNASTSILADTQVPLSTTRLGSASITPWETYTYNFSINASGFYSVKFTYNMTGTADTSIFLTGVNIANTAPICYYTFDSSNAFQIQNIQTSIYDLSYVAVGTPGANTPQITNLQPGTNFQNALYKPSVDSSLNYGYYVNNSAAISTLNTNFTVSVWYYYNSSSAATDPDYGMIWCLSDSIYSRYITFTAKNGSGTGGILILTIGLAGSNFYVGTVAVNGGWNHGVLTCSYDTVSNNTRIYFYVNGVSVNFNGVNTSGNKSNVSMTPGNYAFITIDTGDLFYGKTGLSLYVNGGPHSGNLTWTQDGLNNGSKYGSRGYPGYIGPLHAYNYALTQSQIKSLYNYYYVSPISYYSFEPPPLNNNIQNLITYEYDLSYSQYSGGATTSLSQAKKVLGTQSLLQTAASTCSYYVIPSTSLNLNSGNFSVSCWINMTTKNNAGTYFHIFSIRNENEIFTFALSNLGTDGYGLGILIANATYNSRYYYSSNITINLGGWHHITVTSAYSISANNTIIKLYVDSSLNTAAGVAPSEIAYSSATYPFVRSTNANVTSFAANAFTIPGNFFLSPSTLSLHLIGGPDPSYNYFDGYIDELFVFNNTLTSTQISNLYNIDYSYVTNYNYSTSYTNLTTLCYYDFAKIDASQNILNVQSRVYDLSYNSVSVNSISRNTSVTKLATPSLYQTGVANSSYYTNNTSIQNLNYSFTVAFWINPFSASSSGTVLQIIGQQSGYLKLSFSSTENTFQFNIPGDSSSFSLALKLTGLSNNAFWNNLNWNHVTLTFSYDGTYTYANVYYNGILVNNQYPSSAPTATTYIKPATSQTTPITITGDVFPSNPTTLYVLGAPSITGYNGYLSSFYIFNSALSSEQILNLTGGSISPIPFPKPWGAYIVSSSNGTIFDTTGNGNHVTSVVSTGLTYGVGLVGTTNSYWGGSASIPYFSGGTETKITWPTGSIPPTFTICSITANLGVNCRILQARNSNFLHGHYSGTAGSAYYTGTYGFLTTNATQTSVSSVNNWVVMCATNSANVPFPFNVLANGLPVGTKNGDVIKGDVLTINNSALITNENASYFLLNQVIIWDVALTASQLATMSSIMMNYLQTGVMYYPWSTTNSPINYNYLTYNLYPSQTIPSVSNGSFNGYTITAGNTYSVASPYTQVYGWTVAVVSGLGFNVWLGNGNCDGWTSGMSPVISTGQYFLFIQQNGALSTGTVSQNMTFATPGVYQLSFYAGYRYVNYNTNQTLKVSISNLTVASVALVASVWNTYTYNFTVSTTGTYTITFTFNQSVANDSTIMLTNIVVRNPPPAVTTAPTLQNGSFNAVPFTNANQISSATSTTVPGWTLTSISGTSSPAYGYGNNLYVKASVPSTTPILPPSQYFFILQQSNTASYSISQSITFDSSKIGTFQLFFYSAVRTASGNPTITQRMNVSLTNASTVLSVTAVPLTTKWNTFVYNFTITTAGTYTLTFTFNQTAANDNSIFLTNIVINPLSTIPLDMNNLVMYYPFDNDLLNYANIIPVDDKVVCTGTISTDYTKLNMGSLYLNSASSQYFQTQPFTLTHTGFTAATWCRFATLPSSGANWQRIFDFGTGTTNYIILAYQFVTSPGNQIQLTIAPVNNGFTSGNQVTGYLLTDTKWHHYCVTITPACFVTVYVDGLYYFGNQLTSATFPIGTSLTNSYIGRSQFSAADAYTNGYYNSFIVYNRCLGFSEISSLLSVKNTVLNGNFNNFRNIVDASGTVSLITSIPNGGRTYGGTSVFGITGRMLGWSFTGKCLNFIVNAGNNTASGFYLSTVLSLTSNQQYYIVVQYEVPTPVPLTMNQVIRFTPGTYTLYYTVAGRPNVYNSTNKITSSISGLLSSYTPTLSNTSWTKISQSFTVPYEQSQTLSFIFSNPSFTGDTSILLTNVYISQNTNYLVTSTDVINSYATNVLPLGGLGGFTPTIPNNLFGGLFRRNNGPLLSDSPYYMHGTRSNTGFKVNGIDIGQYFQQTLPFDGSYGYCFEIEYNAFGTVANISDTDAKIIWPENTGIPQGSDGNVYYWLYYTFYYGGSANTGTMYWRCDDAAYLYFNNAAIGNSSNTLSISIVNGLNYIRVAAYNGGGVGPGNPGGFYAALKDSGGNVVAVTNSNWTWSLVPSAYSTTSLYYNIGGWLPFVVNLTTSGTINYSDLTMSGTVYYNQLPINIASYITGAPSGTTYSPSQITTTNGVGTYTFSNISVTLPSGYSTGTYSGSLTVLPTVVNLTLSGTAYYGQSPINIANYITGAPSGTTYNPSQITAAGTYTFSNISVTLPSGYLTGTYSGSLVVNAAIINVTGLTYSNGGQTQFPSVSGYNIMYIKSGTNGTVQFVGYTIKNIFVVGGGAGGANSKSTPNQSNPGLGGGISNNNVNFSGNNTFTITIGGGGGNNAAGSNTTCVCAALSVNYTGNGGTVNTVSNSVIGTQYSYNGLYYGGSGGSGSNNTYRNALLGGGGGGGGGGLIFASFAGETGGTGGGISATLTGGAGGVCGGVRQDGSPGTSSNYGGGGGAGGAKYNPGGSTREGYAGGAGGTGSGTAVGGGASGGAGGSSLNNNSSGGGGGAGGVNTGGGGGGGGTTSNQYDAIGGSGGSGIVIILYI